MRLDIKERQTIIDFMRSVIKQAEVSAEVGNRQHYSQRQRLADAEGAIVDAAQAVVDAWDRTK